MQQITVDLGDRSYPVVVGHGTREMVEDFIPFGTRKVAVLTQREIPLSLDLGIEHQIFHIEDGEEHKTLATVERVCRQMVSAGFSRADCLLAVGGGIVTDVGGFIASVFHRGIPVVHLATTLLAQVDAAIGGKTGVNLPEGKNLVGSYWQPAAVICELDALSTLSQVELRCGYGEVAKYHWLGGGNLDSLDLEGRVSECVRIKADVVASDERESGRRAVLNYGHTLAHAIEVAGKHELRHGEAVAIGLVFAAEVAHRIGRIDGAAVAEHRRVLGRYDLPMTIPVHLADDELIALMGRDKKALRELTMVLDGPRGVEVVTGIDERSLRDALGALR